MSPATHVLSAARTHRATALERALVGAALASLAASSAGCGAKTGLLVPTLEAGLDAGPDALDAADVVDARDAVDAFEACVPGFFTLRPREAEVVFLIDRSNSMLLSLEGGDMPPPGASRWEVLATALERALPPFQTSLAMGSLVFPDAVAPGLPARLQCAVPREITVAPARSNALAITRVLRTTRPGGGTPTFEALQVVRRYFASNPDRARSRYMVLATDGGPNCNFDLNAASCACTSRDPATNLPNCAMVGAFNCVDEARTVATLRASAGEGVPTFVIGIDDPTRPDLQAVLDRMAVAGGRPAMGGAQRYYSVRRPEDLASAFASVQRDIAQCEFVTPSRPDDPDEIVLELDGAPVARDASRTEGWDWTDRDFGALTFFGEACDRASRARVVRARVGCNDR